MSHNPEELCQPRESSAGAERDLKFHERKPAGNDGSLPRNCCRLCGVSLRRTFIDLGKSPLANSYLTSDELNQMEPFYSLHVYVCEQCLLVQLQDFESPDHLFSEYAYFSSYSDAWLKHARAYVGLMMSRFGVNEDCHVVEIASNDGYLLQFFIEKNVPVLGIEPATNIAEVALKNGIPTLNRFFGEGLARELASAGKQADLIVANNVLAHVPDLKDFVGGLKILLKPQGVMTLEFPHLLRLMAENQFDTIYHEHLSYFSFFTVERIFAMHGLTIFDVEELPTHGGSLRIYARHAEDSTKLTSQHVADLRMKELRAGLTQVNEYTKFAGQVYETKRRLLEFLSTAKGEGKSIAGYGAPAKGNTLLNFCGIRTDFLDFTVDRSPHKQGKFLPGTNIPIHHPNRIRETKPDYVLILPWNIKDEIMTQLAYIREWGGAFVVPIPEVTVYS